ncbi:MAG: YebC/PmpR family DNA-binding transcriptional regulator [Candidatus Moranbacteria bacterium]|nr:YebC/PmpR family DNA-binding transcriptional regulator [Candidatus Moranbacteria bacterium]
MSGHNKWSKIKHKKAATDAKRSKIFSVISKEIILAAKNGGDPDYNFQLKMAVDKARASNMPNDNINKAIRRGSGVLKDGAQLEEYLFEAYGPNQVAMLIRAVSDNKNRTLSEVRTFLTKNGGKMVEGGSISWQFDQVGRLAISEINKSEDELEEIIIESGADDYQREGKNLVVYAPFQKLQVVKEFLEKAGLKIEEATLTYLPQNVLELSNKKIKVYANFIEKIEEQDDVVEIYDNLI